MAPIGRLGNGGFSSGGLAGGGLAGGGLAGSGGDSVLALGATRDYVGRVGKAIPAAGIVLPAAQNGTGAITYSATGVPAGLTFTASTRKITGNPTGSGVNTIAYKATDSSSPAVSVTKEIDFPVVAATSLITSNDFDNRGYGLDTKTIDMFAIVEGEANIATGSNGTTDIWLRPPRGMRGILHDDALNDLGFGPNRLAISRMRSNIGGAQIQLNQNSLDIDGNALPSSFSDLFAGDLAGFSLFLQTLTATLERPASDVVAGGGFCRWAMTNAQRTIVRSLGDDARFIWAFATTT